jgi:tetratricopeptide (TPR) repeat protein
MRIVRNLLLAAVTVGIVATVAVVVLNSPKRPAEEEPVRGESRPGSRPAKTPADPVPEKPFKLAVAAAKEGKSADAKRLLEKAITDNPDDPIVEDFLRAVAPPMSPADAYVLFPNPDLAFEHLIVDGIALARPPFELEKLLDLHALRAPDNPRLLLVRGRLQFRRGEYDKADASFDHAAEKGASPEDLETVKHERIECRFHRGLSPSALRDFQPYEKTFNRLESLAIRYRRLDDLDALIASQSKKSNDEGLLHRQLRLRIAQGKAKEATDVFLKLLESTKGNKNDVIATYGYLMGKAGLVQPAYEALRDRNLFWRPIGVNPEAELELAELVRRDKPDDPQVELLRARAFERRRAYARSAEIFTKNWSRLSEEQKQQSENTRQTAMAHVGRWKEAMERGGSKEDRYRAQSVLYLMSLSGRWKEIAELLDAHGAALEPSELEVWRMRVQIRTGHIEEVKPPEKGFPILFEGNAVVDDCDAVGRLMDAQRFLGPHYSVPRIAELLLARGQLDELDKLVGDKRSRPYDLPRGELMLRRGQYAAVDDEETARSPIEQRSARSTHPRGMEALLPRARAHRKRTVETYRQLGCSDDMLSGLANICFRDKLPDELKALIAAALPFKADRDPEAVIRSFTLEAHELQLLHLRGDDKTFLARCETMDRDFLYCREIDALRIRSLVRLGKGKEAVDLARSLLKHEDRTGYSERILDFLHAHLAWNDPRKMIQAVDEFADDEELVEAAYADPELGPRLRSAEYQPFREKCPERK